VSKKSVAPKHDVHLSRFECHDEDEMWCAAHPGYETREIDEATCMAFLRAAADYGVRCAERAALLSIRIAKERD
jgi:hypothetical protein